MQEKSPSDEQRKAEEKHARWDWPTIKDRAAIGGVILAIIVLALMQLDLAVLNFDCSFLDFVMFKCNRWSALG